MLYTILNEWSHRCTSLFFSLYVVDLRQRNSRELYLCVFFTQIKIQLTYFTILMCYIHLFPGIMQKDEMNKICVGKERLA